MARRRVPANPHLNLMRKGNDLQSAFESMMPSHWAIRLKIELRREEGGLYNVDIAAWKNGALCLVGVSVDSILVSACKAVFPTQLGQVRIYNPFGNEWITIWPKELQASDVPCETSDNRGFSAFPSDYTRRLDAENR